MLIKNLYTIQLGDAHPSGIRHSVVPAHRDMPSSYPCPSAAGQSGDTSTAPTCLRRPLVVKLFNSMINAQGRNPRKFRQAEIGRQGSVELGLFDHITLHMFVPFDCAAHPHLAPPFKVGLNVLRSYLKAPFVKRGGGIKWSGGDVQSFGHHITLERVHAVDKVWRRPPTRHTPQEDWLDGSGQKCKPTA